MRRWVGVAVLTAGCAEPSAGSTRSPRFAPEVRAVLAARCLPCHDGAGAAGGWRADTLAGALGCPSGSDGGGGSPVLSALEREDHRDLLGAAERAIVAAWVRGGSPAGAAGVHGEGVGDPRSPAFHAPALRGSRWAPMLSAATPGACGRCHDGAPTRPASVTRPMPGATACTSCHERPQGALACDTCHRVGGSPGATGCVAAQGNRARDPHAAHLAPRVRAQGLACGACHPARDATLSSGEHGDGVVQIALDPALAGVGARYEREGGTCATRCHARGGDTPSPRWRLGAALSCGSCHGAPPRDHPSGRCDTCHAESNAEGTALRPGPLHMNGRVDLGRAEGGCADCHGQGGDPWPLSGAHALHRDAPRSRPVACYECHAVPSAVRSAGHLDGVVRVSFGTAARARGSQPAWSGGACAEVACHGAGLRGGAPTLQWTQPSSQPGCGGCHALPPPPPHPLESGCASVLCHGDRVAPSPSGPRISPAGRSSHVDGVVQFGRAP